MTELIVAEQHSQLYDLWLEREYRNLSVCHVDFHCDMRGLFIDRRRGRARFVWRHIPYIHYLDPGSFLSHAVMNGIVTRLRWVHDDFGGRKYDDLWCVKYETDCSALPYRLLGEKKSVPLTYAEQTFADWGGPQPGEQLDLDWDAIAFAGYGEKKIRRLMAEILERDMNSDLVFVARSPEYSHVDRHLFDEFIAALERKFKVKAVHLPASQPPSVQLSAFWRFYRKADQFLLKQMRKLRIY
jgi:hypothetical protein